MNSNKENSTIDEPLDEDRGLVALMHDRRAYTFLSAKKAAKIVGVLFYPGSRYSGSRSSFIQSDPKRFRLPN